MTLPDYLNGFFATLTVVALVSFTVQSRRDTRDRKLHAKRHFLYAGFMTELKNAEGRVAIGTMTHDREMVQQALLDMNELHARVAEVTATVS